MTTRIIIARHGNTFTKDQTPTRVGGKTDLALVETERGSNVGKYLAIKGYNPVIAFAAPLKRTKETAELAIKAFGKNIPLEIDESFREIDYGPDENKVEEDVILRLGKASGETDIDKAMLKGQEIIDLWNAEAIVPNGWKVSPQEMIDTWLSWGKKAEKDFKNQDILIVSSNGIIRFAPYLTGDFNNFAKDHDLKVTTGGVCVFEKEDNEPFWHCTEWNVKPSKII